MYPRNLLDIIQNCINYKIIHIKTAKLMQKLDIYLPVNTLSVIQMFLLLLLIDLTPIQQKVVYTKKIIYIN